MLRYKYWWTEVWIWWKTKHCRCEVLIFQENKHTQERKNPTQTKNQSNKNAPTQPKKPRFKITMQNKNPPRNTPQNKKKKVANKQDGVHFSTQRTSWFTFEDAEEMLTWWEQCFYGTRRDHSSLALPVSWLKASVVPGHSLLLLYWDDTMKE